MIHSLYSHQDKPDRSALATRVGSVGSVKRLMDRGRPHRTGPTRRIFFPRRDSFFGNLSARAAPDAAGGNFCKKIRFDVPADFGGTVGSTVGLTPKTGNSPAKKLTRPDGEIRAGRFDRRRGSGGRERRSGLLTPGLAGRFDLLVSQTPPKVQTNLEPGAGNFGGACRRRPRYRTL
jgi:hypothetical protein